MLQSGGGTSGVFKDNTTWVWSFDGAGALSVGTIPWSKVTGAPTFLKSDGTVAATSKITIGGTSPILALQDSNNLTAFLRAEDNTFHIMRGGVGSPTPDSGPNGRHPMSLSLITGDVVFSGNVAAFSDGRFKKDIRPIENALSKIEKLNGVTFSALDSDQRRTGLIAQDVLAVMPEAVTVQDDKTLAVAYGNLVGLLVEAIKELKSELATVQSELALLRS